MSWSGTFKSLDNGSMAFFNLKDFKRWICFLYFSHSLLYTSNAEVMTSEIKAKDMTSCPQGTSRPISGFNAVTWAYSL